MKLKDCFQIQKRELVSIVGAGGKTSLVMYLADQLEGRIIVSASTKMYKPSYDWSYFIDTPVLWSSDHQVVVAANQVKNGKIAGLNKWAYQAAYDYYLVEADGSKTLALKGWSSDEPVIDGGTTTTIGVVDVTAVGKPANNQTVFRLDAFKALTQVSEQITVQNLVEMILHEDGLFRYSKGRRILFLNKVESEALEGLCNEICASLLDVTGHRIDDVVVGSVSKGLGIIRGIR